MAAVSDFERFVLPHINAPLPAVHDALVDAAIEYCIRTRVLRDVVEPITLVRGVAEYEIEAPEADTQVVEVLKAWLSQEELKAVTRPELDALYPQGWLSLSVGNTAQIKVFYCRLPGLIRLVPMLNNKAARALTLEVAYAPTRTATTMPDVLLNRYAEKIAVGALSRLHQHNADYADVSRAVTYLQMFEGFCHMLADESSHGFAHYPLRTLQEDL